METKRFAMSGNVEIDRILIELMFMYSKIPSANVCLNRSYLKGKVIVKRQTI